MKKSSQNPIQKKAPAGEQIKTIPAKERISDALFAYILTGVYFVIVLIGILHHEMWRDEYQAWLIARNSHSVSDLFANFKYEGHPFLWFFILYVINIFTSDIFYMQLIHIIVAAATVYLVLRYAPFSRFHKLLFPFGYFLLFEYALISRNYVLCIFFAVLLCVLFRDVRKNIFYIAAVFILLANSTIFGVILSLSFGLYLLYDIFIENQHYLQDRVFIRNIAIAALLVLVGIVFSIWQIMPEPDNGFPVAKHTKIEMLWFKNVLLRLLVAYFPLPAFDPASKIEFWNKSMLFYGVNIGDATFNMLFYLASAAALIFLFLVRTRIQVVWLYVSGTLMLLAYYYYTHLLFFRYTGCLFVILMASSWLFFGLEKNRKSASATAKMLLNIYLSIVLLVHVIAGIMAYSKDIKYTFSNMQELGAYIVDNGYADEFIFGSCDYTVSPLSQYTDKPIYFPEYGRALKFMVWNSEKKWYPPINEILQDAAKQIQPGRDSILMILNAGLTFSQTGKLVEYGPINDTIAMTLIKACNKKHICGYEEFFVYRVKKRK